MKLLHLIRNDIEFQYRYGFYALYLFFTLLYIAILYFVPQWWSHKAGVVIIISDPLLIGLVFMGALVLFEKSERVLNSMAVSPISADQYLASKSISIALIALVSSSLIAVFGAGVVSAPLLILGVGVGSLLFSFVGLIVSAGVQTLNGFIIRIVPVLTFATSAVLCYAMGVEHWSLELHPCTAIINLLCATKGMVGVSTVVLITWAAAAFLIARRRVAKMIRIQTKQY